MTSVDFMLIGTGAIIAILISYVFYRYTFDVSIRTRHIKAQTELLGKIAQKHGVGQDEVETIIRNANNQ